MLGVFKLETHYKGYMNKYIYYNLILAGDVHQLSFSGVGYGTPYHHTFSAEIVDLKHAFPCKPIIPASVDTCAAISFLQHES
jgi:hypothetical protein